MTSNDDTIYSWRSETGQHWVYFPVREDGSGGVSQPTSESAHKRWLVYGAIDRKPTQSEL